MAIGGVAWLLAGSGGGETKLTLPTATVVRGTLVVSVTEAGEIKAEKKKIIANNLRWTVVVAERVDEGTTVKKGDKNIRFECKELLEAIDKQKLEVTAAENETLRAEEQIDLTTKECRNQVAKASSTLENAVNSLRKFKEHEKAQQLREAQSKFALAQEDLKLAKGKMEFMKRVNQTTGLEETYSRSTVEAEELRVRRLELEVTNAEAQVKNLKDYEHPKELRRLELAVDDAKLEVERANLEQKAQTRMAKANEESKKTTWEMRKRALKDMLEEKDKLVIRADAPGIIIYDSGRWWRPPDLAIGALVPSRRRLMRIPDMSTLRIFSRVFEGISEKVKVGMPALIRLDSRTAEVYTGKVAKIAKLASSQDGWLSRDVKVFPIEVVFDRIPGALKPGSTAKIELILAELPNVLIVPIAAVFTEQEQTYCWKLAGGLPKRTEIKIGRVSETQVQILAGLAQGDTVLLAPPPQADAGRDAAKGPSKALRDRAPTTGPAASQPTTGPAASQPTTGPAASQPTTGPAASQPTTQTTRPSPTTRPGAATTQAAGDGA